MRSHVRRLSAAAIGAGVGALIWTASAQAFGLAGAVLGVWAASLEAIGAAFFVHVSLKRAGRSWDGRRLTGPV